MALLPYQGSACIEVFSSTGRKPLEELKIMVPKAVKRTYDKGLKGACVVIDGEVAPSARIEIPKGKVGLGLRHPVMCIQLWAGEASPLYFEFVCGDGKARRRIVLSTSCHKTTSDPLHVKLPLLNGIRRCQWVTLAVNVRSLFDAAFPSVSMHTIERLTIGPTCRIRKVLSLRAPLPATYCTGDLPSSIDFPPGVHHIIQQVSSDPSSVSSHASNHRQQPAACTALLFQTVVNQEDTAPDNTTATTANQLLAPSASTPRRSRHAPGAHQPHKTPSSLSNHDFSVHSPDSSPVHSHPFLLSPRHRSSPGNSHAAEKIADTSQHRPRPRLAYDASMYKKAKPPTPPPGESTPPRRQAPADGGRSGRPVPPQKAANRHPHAADADGLRGLIRQSARRGSGASDGSQDETLPTNSRGLRRHPQGADVDGLRELIRQSARGGSGASDGSENDPLPTSSRGFRGPGGGRRPQGADVDGLREMVRQSARGGSGASDGSQDETLPTSSRDLRGPGGGRHPHGADVDGLRELIRHSARGGSSASDGSQDSSRDLQGPGGSRHPHGADADGLRELVHQAARGASGALDGSQDDPLPTSSRGFPGPGGGGRRHFDANAPLSTPDTLASKSARSALSARRERRDPGDRPEAVQRAPASASSTDEDEYQQEPSVASGHHRVNAKKAASVRFQPGAVPPAPEASAAGGAAHRSPEPSFFGDITITFDDRMSAVSSQRADRPAARHADDANDQTLRSSLASALKQVDPDAPLHQAYPSVAKALRRAHGIGRRDEEDADAEHFQSPPPSSRRDGVDALTRQPEPCPSAGDFTVYSLDDTQKARRTANPGRTTHADPTLPAPHASTPSRDGASGPESPAEPRGTGSSPPPPRRPGAAAPQPAAAGRERSRCGEPPATPPSGGPAPTDAAGAAACASTMPVRPGNAPSRARADGPSRTPFSLVSFRSQASEHDWLLKPGAPGVFSESSPDQGAPICPERETRTEEGTPEVSRKANAAEAVLLASPGAFGVARRKEEEDGGFDLFEEVERMVAANVEPGAGAASGADPAAKDGAARPASAASVRSRKPPSPPDAKAVSSASRPAARHPPAIRAGPHPLAHMPCSPEPSQRIRSDPVLSRSLLEGVSVTASFGRQPCSDRESEASHRDALSVKPKGLSFSVSTFDSFLKDETNGGDRALAPLKNVSGVPVWEDAEESNAFQQIVGRSDKKRTYRQPLASCLNAAHANENRTSGVVKPTPYDADGGKPSKADGLLRASVGGLKQQQTPRSKLDGSGRSSGSRSHMKMTGQDPVAEHQFPESRDDWTASVDGGAVNSDVPTPVGPYLMDHVGSDDLCLYGNPGSPGNDGFSSCSSSFVRSGLAPSRSRDRSTNINVPVVSGRALHSNSLNDDDVCRFDPQAAPIDVAASALSTWTLPDEQAVPRNDSPGDGQNQRTLVYDAQLGYYYDPATNEYFEDLDDDE
eukprot:gene19082-29368_t